MPADPNHFVEDPAERIAALERRLDDLGRLVLRSYEESPRLAAEVLRARREPSYAHAYDGEPLVTVRIGAYRGGATLFDRALSSVRGQTYENWEAVVVCDGRDQPTATAITAIGDSRIRCLQRPRNGPYPHDQADRWLVAGCHPFNLGVAVARGAWIAPIDQDDEWEPDHLEVLLGRARERRAELVYGVSRVVLDDGSESSFGRWPPEQGDFGFQTSIYHAGLAALLYDVNSHLAGEPADWNLARRMLEAGVCFDFIDRVVTSYYVSAAEPAFNFWKERQRERGEFGVENE